MIAWLQTNTKTTIGQLLVLLFVVDIHIASVSVPNRTIFYFVITFCELTPLISLIVSRLNRNVMAAYVCGVNLAFLLWGSLVMFYPGRPVRCASFWADLHHVASLLLALICPASWKISFVEYDSTVRRWNWLLISLLYIFMLGCRRKLQCEKPNRRCVIAGIILGFTASFFVSCQPDLKCRAFVSFAFMTVVALKSCDVVRRRRKLELAFLLAFLWAYSVSVRLSEVVNPPMSSIILRPKKPMKPGI